MRRVRVAVPVVLVALAAACAQGGPARSADQGAFRAASVAVGASVDPTVHGARLLPEVVDETQGYGTEPGGGVRAITAGLRVVTARDGSLSVADDRLPQAPQSTTALPERLGGGFLFVLGSAVWRADHWLDPARPIFVSTQAIQSVVPGLDRVYLRSQNAYVALDGRTGKVLDLGPWPATPFVASYAAADGWRAAAVTDLRGVVATFDAGATWRALDLPIDPRLVLATGDALAVGGIENGRPNTWFEVRGDGAVARLASPPREARGKMAAAETAPRRYLPGGTPVGVALPPTASPATERERAAEDGRAETAPDAAARIFGKRPLAAAIEDGWPLTDGTAVVARDGALGRVRLSDGVLVDVALAAFPLKPAQCHPVSLTRVSALGAFGFVCGEPRGTTVIYAYDPLRGRLVELRRFDRPRVVTSSGNGAIAVRGPCAEDGDPNGTPREPKRILSRPDGGADAGTDERADRQKDEREQAAKDASNAKAAASEARPYCILGHDNTWREIHVRGDVGSERVVVLADGRVLVVSPPQGETSPARLTLLENGRATTIPIVFPTVAPDIGRVLRLGLWLDGFEERKPGVVGGWIEAGGVMLGIQITLGGQATPGQFVRDAGLPFVAGRYGLGWTASRRGFETTDGGMTWASLELPEALVATSKVQRRACGPIGCLAAGWMRVGWGEAKKPALPAPPAPFRAPVAASPPQLALACEPMTPPMPAPPAPPVRPPPSLPTGKIPARSYGGAPVLANLAPPGVVDLPPFFAQGAPVLHSGERGVPVEVQEHLEHYPRLGVLARVYAWGPASGDWDTQGRWQVKWLSPFAAWPETRASVPTLPPAGVFHVGGSAVSTFAYGGSFGAVSSLFQIASGDDSSHALLLAKRAARTDVTPFELEADRAPIEIKRADGEPFLEIEAATRAAGRWFFATSTPGGASSPATTIWQADGAVARELVRIARAAPENGRPTGIRLARRSDGRSIGLVVDGAPTAERSTATRWVLPIDLETGQMAEPELLGYVDLAGRALETCADDLAGWVFDASLPGSTVRVRLPSGAATLRSVYARVRATTTRVCVERLAGTYDGRATEQVAQLTRPLATRGATVARSGELVATALIGDARVALRCTLAK